jgi:predicted dehydrogenase
MVDVIIVGYGSATQELYFPALRSLESAGVLKVRAIVAPDEQVRDLCLGTFPDAAEASTLDAVVIPPGALVHLATPARHHPLQASSAFKRGWHVFCESPFAASARDASAMIAAAHRHERLLAADLHRRRFSTARYLRTLCRDHLLGPVIRFSIHEGAPLALPAGAPPFSKAVAPDGVLVDIGLHSLDFVTWCLGAVSIESYADDAMGGVEANAFVDVAFPEGVRGTLHFSRDWPTNDLCEFVFERAIVRWRVDEANRLTVQLASAPSALAGTLVSALIPGETIVPERLPSRVEAVAEQLRNFAAAILGTERLDTAPSEALTALRFMDDCYARRALLEQPWFTPNEAAYARSLSPAGLRRP